MFRHSGQFSNFRFYVNRTIDKILKKPQVSYKSLNQLDNKFLMFDTLHFENCYFQRL